MEHQCGLFIKSAGIFGIISIRYHKIVTSKRSMTLQLQVITCIVSQGYALILQLRFSNTTTTKAKVVIL